MRKALLTLIVLFFMSFWWASEQLSNDGKLHVSKTEQKIKKVFKDLASFPAINDTTEFINDLRETFDLHVHESPVQAREQKIAIFKKVKLYGSSEEYFLIEYDWVDGSMSDFPWKYQLLLAKDGELVKVLAGQRFELVTIFPNQYPFLLITKVTARWNGGHEIYKVSSDTLENVYEGYYNYEISTVAGGEGIFAFEPNELDINFFDLNKDGFNDIIFTGQKLMLGKYTKNGFWYDVENNKPFTTENPAERIPIKYVFLYDKKTGHFKVTG